MRSLRERSQKVIINSNKSNKKQGLEKQKGNDYEKDEKISCPVFKKL